MLSAKSNEQDAACMRKKHVTHIKCNVGVNSIVVNVVADESTFN